jgi:hypothetical protein
VINIWDSHRTYNDEELLYAENNLAKLKCLTKYDCPTALYKDFVKSRQLSQGFSNCKTDKTMSNSPKDEVFSCENKAKTRGVILAVYNCFIMSRTFWF